MAMIRIDIADLEDDMKEGAITHIESRLPLKSERKGDLVTFEDKSPRSHVTNPEVRTSMKNYIHSMNVRKKYRILSENGSLKFVKQKTDQQEEEK